MTAIDETGRIYSSSFISETGDSIYSTSHNSIGRRLFNVVRTFYQTCTENVHISDTTAKSITRYMIALVEVQNAATNAITRLLSESITTTNSCSKTLTRTIIDGFSITDTMLKFRGTIKLLTESISVTATMGERILTRLITDVVNSVDEVHKTITRPFVAETITIVDSITKTVIKSLEEAVYISVSILKTITRIVVESITIINILGNTTLRTMVEAINISDSAIRTIIKLITTTITVSNTAVKSIARLFTESTAFSDTVFASKIKLRVFIESITVIDDLNWLHPIIKTVKYTMAISVKKLTKLLRGGEELE